MSKLQSKLLDQKSLIADIYRRYMITIIICGLICILFIINDNFIDYNDEQLLETRIIPILVLTALGSAFVEALADTVNAEIKKLMRLIGVPISLVVAVVWDIVLNNINENLYEFRYEIVNRIFISYICILVFMTVYYIIKNTGLSFQAYLRNAVFNLLKMGFTFGAINIGFIFIVALFDALIVSIDQWTWLSNFELIVTGFVYIPYGLICITDKSKNSSGFTRGFLRYALMPLVAAAVLIIYIYIIKVLFGSDISNVIFSTCAMLFMIGAPIWEMAYYEDENGNTLWSKLIRYMPYIYAPFILLEIYSIAVRIAQYGLTEARYFGVLLIIFQIIYVAWRWIQKRLLKSEGNGKETLVLVGLALLLIAFVCPLLNVSYSCFMSQRSRFTRNYAVAKSLADEAYNNQNIEATELSEQERVCVNKYLGAYSFLKYSVRGSEYLNEKYDKEELSQLAATLKTAYVYQNETDSTEVEWNYLRYNADSDKFDISGGYSQLYTFSVYEDYDEEYGYEHYKAVDIYYDKRQQCETVDVTAIINMLVEEEADYDYNTDRPPYVIGISGDTIGTSADTRIIITYFKIVKQQDQSLYRGLEIEGYILKK